MPRNTPYFVDYLGGFAGFNNPGSRVFYVGPSGYTAYDGNGPSNTNDGLSPQTPFSTIQNALDQCVTGRGDIVAILPGSYTVTAALTMSKDDVTLCSAYPVEPQQRSKCVIVNATDVNTVIVTGNNCKIIGLTFDDNVATATANTAVIRLASTATAAVEVSGTVIQNCYLDMLGSDTDRDGICVGLTADATDGAPHTLIEGCTILDPDQYGIIINVGSPYTVVRNCLIYDLVNLCLAGISVLATSCSIEDCEILCTDSTGAACIKNGVAAARLTVTDCRLHATGADTIGILAIATATQRTSGNWITAIGAGNLIDYTTDNTTPSADTFFSGVFNTTPPATVVGQTTVGGADA
uniref:Putative pectate lyase n=1 Tax=viral metagenome TaxID=1070528 RepID=A0A6M3KZF7_9ZZZZ